MGDQKIDDKPPVIPKIKPHLLRRQRCPTLMASFDTLYPGIDYAGNPDHPPFAARISSGSYLLFAAFLLPSTVPMRQPPYENHQSSPDAHPYRPPKAKNLGRSTSKSPDCPALHTVAGHGWQSDGNRNLSGNIRWESLTFFSTLFIIERYRHLQIFNTAGAGSVPGERMDFP